MRDAISTARLAQCHPLLRQKMEAVDAEMDKQGILIRITQGLRTDEEQAEIYAKGRNADGVIVDPHEVVTHAPPGYSAHNFGVAVDVVPFYRNSTAINWDVLHPDFKALVVACGRQRLSAGIYWPKPKTDPDHFQLAEFPVTPTDAMRKMLAEKGLDAVWATVPSDGLLKDAATSEVANV